MPASPASGRIPLLGVLLFAIGGLAILMLGVAGARPGMSLLVDSGAEVAILADPTARLGLADIRTRADWRPFASRDYIHAAHREAVWVRITLRNPTPDPVRGILADADYINDHLELWTPDPLAPDGWRRQRSGQSVPGAEKPVWGREAAFPVELAPRATLTAYLRATNHFPTWLHLQWWPEARRFHAAQLRATMADTLYFGILAALFVYNAVLWARLRHRDLGLYLGYIGAFSIFMAIGRSMDQVLGLALHTPLAETIHSAALATSGAFLIQFGRDFLALAKTAPRLDRVVGALLPLNLLLALGAPLLLHTTTSAWIHYVIGAQALTHASLLVSALVAWRAGVGHARYFLLSFGLLFLATTPITLSWLLAIPFGNQALGMLLGSALEMLFLSLALSQRFARLQQERHAAQLAEQQARLEALRYQLNPHFFFNALNSIYGLVLPHSAAAADLVRRLSDFCRVTLLRAGEASHPLARELAMLRNYLEIEQARWGDRLVIEFALDPASDDFPIPPFLLLPLLENAIKHGGATSPDVLTLRLSTRLEPDRALAITLVNSGAWAPPSPRDSRHSTSTGLANIRERLARAFGPRATLSTSADDGWVILALRLPPPAAAP